MQTRSPTVSRMRVALGTFVAIEAQAPSEPAAEKGIAAAFAAVAEVDRLMHPSRPGSDLALLARASRGVTLALQPWTWEVLELSRRLCEWSRGAFDPCLESVAGHTDCSRHRSGRAGMPSSWRMAISATTAATRNRKTVTRRGRCGTAATSRK